MIPEPITPEPPRGVRVPTMAQFWGDAVFLHWEIPREAAAAWLPPGAQVDRLDGRTYVGLIGLRIDVDLLGVVPVPYLGSFGEINVRVYSVDRHGRRGVVFCSLDADRLVPALAGRVGYGLPYMWSEVRASHRGNTVRYTARRRWSGTGHPTTDFTIRIGEPIPRPSLLEHFMTARYALHWARAGYPLWAAASHRPWVLYTAELLSIDDDLIAAAGLPPPDDEPVSALWSPGVRALIGPPAPLEWQLPITPRRRDWAERKPPVEPSPDDF